MNRKYHTNKLQTKPRHRDEEPQSINSNETSERQRKATSSLLLVNMIADLERTQSNTYQYKNQTPNHHRQWELYKTTNQQQQNHRLKMDNSLSH